MSTLFNKARLIGLAVAALIFVLDQYIKFYVTGPLDINRPGDSMELVPFFDLTFAQNFGVSMGIFEATSPEMRWMLVAVTALIAFIVFIWMMREKAFGDILGLSMILGGALGNIRDRFNLGYVVDYADLHIGTFRPFLIFNLADAAITIGVLIILARAFFLRDKDDNEPAAAETATET